MKAKQRAPRLKAQPLIFEPQHKNIATLMAFLITIFLGIGAGWLAGGVLSGSFKSTPVEQAASVTETAETASLNSVAATQPEADEAKQPAQVIEDKAAQTPVVEEQRDNEATKTTARRRGSSRRSYVGAQAGEPLPLAVIKGKPLKKAFKQFKRVKVW